MDSEDIGQPLRVALIGYGHGGAVFHAPLISTTPGLELAAIVTGSPARRAQAHSAYPRAAILDSADAIWQAPTQYDLVVVATPNRTHAPLGLAALRAGLPVVIDKPMAVTVAEGLELIAASAEAGKLLTVFHNARWSSTFLSVQRILASGLLGPVVRFEARMERYRPLPRPGAWRELGAPGEGGGLLYDLGSHLIDEALVLFGVPAAVYAELEHRRPGSQVDDDTFLALQFADGARAHLWASYLAREPGPAVRVIGLMGTYEKAAADPQENALRQGLRPGDVDWGIEPPERWGRLSTEMAGGLHVDGAVESLPGSYERFYMAVRDAVREGAPPPVAPEEALAVLRVIAAAQESARAGAVIPL